MKTTITEAKRSYNRFYTIVIEKLDQFLCNIKFLLLLTAKIAIRLSFMSDIEENIYIESSTAFRIYNITTIFSI